MVIVALQMTKQQELQDLRMFHRVFGTSIPEPPRSEVISLESLQGLEATVKELFTHRKRFKQMGISLVRKLGSG